MPGKELGGPDFREAPVAPYFLDPANVCRPGDSRLLEVPVTILRTQPLLARSRRLQEVYARNRRRLSGRVLNKLFRLDPQWLRPYGHMSGANLRAVCETAERQGLPAVEMMFHSSELMPGGSPYNPDEAAIERLYEKLESVFAHAQARSWRGATLTEFAREYSSRTSVAGNGQA
jgi:hypothetical protein